MPRETSTKPCNLPEEEEIQEIADLFKVFADASRIKILLAMYDGERSVSEISEAVGMTPSAVSHQLAVLRSAKLASARRDGKQIFYSLADEHVHTIIGVGREHIEE